MTALLLAFPLGVSSGLLLALGLGGLALYQLGFVRWPSSFRSSPAPPGHGSSRLQGYLHGI